MGVPHLIIFTCMKKCDADPYVCILQLAYICVQKVSNDPIGKYKLLYIKYMVYPAIG